MTNNATTGAKGEQLAADFLAQNGFEILARNYRYKRSEIDLIVKKSNLLVFVEVKARKSNAFGEPESFVDEKKVLKIMEGAEQFVYETNWKGNIRFDIVSVKPGTVPEIMHFEDAFH